MIQIGRVKGEVCSVLAAWCGKVTLTLPQGMQFLSRMFDRKKCVLGRSALRVNFLLSLFNVQCYCGQSYYT